MATKSEMLLRKILTLPPSKYAEFFEAHKKENWVDLEGTSSAHIQGLNRVMNYFSCRSGTDGCGEKSHDDAVKYSNKQQIKLRKAMGFSYPERGIFSF